MSVEEIRKLVSQAKLDSALSAARALANSQGDQGLDNLFLQLESRYNSNERESRMGVITTAEYSQGRARITYALLESLNDLEDTTNSPTPTVNTPPTPPVTTGNDLPEVKKIVFLAANPTNTAKLKLDAERSQVAQKLQDSPNFGQFNLKMKEAVTPNEFREYLFLEKPAIVHFSGHGDLQAPEVQAVLTRGTGREALQAPPAEEAGIFLVSVDKRGAQFVGAAFLRHAFRTLVQNHGVQLEAVIFNACYSQEQAEAISAVVPDAYVVGTTWEVGDDAAIAFSTGFYFGIAQGMSLPNAINEGIGNALAYNEPEDRFVVYHQGEKQTL